VTRFLHVANGTSTTRLIEAAGIPGARSIWADPLYEGSVPAGLGDAELLDVRARFIGDSDMHTDPEVANALREWRAVIDARDTYDELVLWYEHDLFDQLNLLQLLPQIRRRVAVSTRVSLICVGSFPGRPRFKGLGELTPPELASLFDTREPLTESQHEVAERGWQAFREPTPEGLERLLQTDLAALPFLSRALRRFLEDYPWTTDGLSRTERRLMRLAESSPTRLMTIFPRMSEDEDAYYVTDGTLIWLAAELASGPAPLLATTPAIRGADLADLEATVSLTDAGREVLSGRTDRIAARGFDRWMGGVHLRSNADLWRWDPAAGRVTRD
jgi:hypothetical protein